MDMKWGRNNLQLLWISLFGISMAFFESSIVVYLRAIYYPEGFTFPLKIVDPHIAVTELLRELASLVMIVSVALIATRNFMQRFAHFLFMFAVWDIFYYVFLKLLLGWPESLLTWDILFLIPVPWAGPVVSPVLISVIMILFALTIHYYNCVLNDQFYLEIKEWLFMLAGAVVVFVSFIWDYVSYIFGHVTSEAVSVHALFDNIESITLNYIPDGFNWWIFLAGALLLLCSLFLIHYRNRKLIR